MIYMKIPMRFLVQFTLSELQDRVLKFARNTISRETFSAADYDDYDMPDIVVETMTTRSKLANLEGRLPSMYD